MRKSACSPKPTYIAFSFEILYYIVDPPSQYSTQKNLTMHTTTTRHYVIVYGTQSAIYRLKITTSVELNQKRATTTNDNFLVHTNTYTHARALSSACKEATVKPQCRKYRRMLMMTTASDGKESKKQNIESTCVYNFWARCCCCFCLRT